MTGTSMAASHVTGAVAVLMQLFPYMTAEQISAVLKTTATDLVKPGIDERFGWGKINLKDAIDGPKMFIAPADIPAEFYVPGSYTNTNLWLTYRVLVPCSTQVPRWSGSVRGRNVRWMSGAMTLPVMEG